MLNVRRAKLPRALRTLEELTDDLQLHLNTKYKQKKYEFANLQVNLEDIPILEKLDNVHLPFRISYERIIHSRIDILGVTIDFYMLSKDYGSNEYPCGISIYSLGIQFIINNTIADKALAKMFRSCLDVNEILFQYLDNDLVGLTWENRPSRINPVLEAELLALQ